MKRTDLSYWRVRIDGLDCRIFKLLAQRSRVARQIARVKMLEGKKIYDAHREKQVIKARQALARSFDLNKDFVRSLMNLIMHYSKDVQKDVLCKQNSKQ